MKKILFIALALSLVLGQGVLFADVQIDEGQAKGGNAPIKFFIGRVTGSSLISADRVVVWDSTSMDGITVKTTTTSADKLVAGITIDAIQGVSSDTLAEDAGNSNWGRIQTWGIHANVRTAAGSGLSAGRLAITSSTAGNISDNNTDTIVNLSSDGSMVGVALESTASNTTDIMVKVD